MTVNFITTWLYKFIDDDKSFTDGIGIYSSDKSQHSVLVFQEVELVQHILLYTRLPFGKIFWLTDAIIIKLSFFSKPSDR